MVDFPAPDCPHKSTAFPDTATHAAWRAKPPQVGANSLTSSCTRMSNHGSRLKPTKSRTTRKCIDSPQVRSAMTVALGGTTIAKRMPPGTGAARHGPASMVVPSSSGKTSTTSVCTTLAVGPMRSSSTSRAPRGHATLVSPPLRQSWIGPKAIQRTPLEDAARRACQLLHASQGKLCMTDCGASPPKAQTASRASWATTSTVSSFGG